MTTLDLILWIFVLVGATAWGIVTVIRGKLYVRGTGGMTKGPHGWLARIIGLFVLSGCVYVWLLVVRLLLKI